MMNLRQPFSVLVVIYNENLEFLVLQRKDDPTFWQSVTGGIDAGESPLQTAYREVLEETGVDAKRLHLTINEHQTTHQYEIRPQWLHRYVEDVSHNTEHVFSLKVPKDTVIKLAVEEHLDYQWLSQSAAAEKVWSDTNRLEILNIEA